MAETPPPIRLALDVHEAADAICISVPALRRLTRAGVVPHAKLGHRIVYPVAALQRWLEEQATAKTDSPDEP